MKRKRMGMYILFSLNALHNLLVCSLITSKVCCESKDRLSSTIYPEIIVTRRGKSAVRLKTCLVEKCSKR